MRGTGQAAQFFIGWDVGGWNMAIESRCFRHAFKEN